MTRPLILGNSRLHVGINSKGEWIDIYYPYVGYPNHGHRISLGLFDGEKMKWMKDYKVKLSYLEEGPIALIENEDVKVISFVHYLKPILWNRVINPKNLTLFFYHDLHIKENPFKDTAMLDKKLGAIVHYKDDVYFSFSSIPKFEQFAVGIKEWGGLEGTWKDAEDGLLSGNMVSHGLVDSCIGLKYKLVDHFMVVSNSFKDLKENLISAKEEGFNKSLEETKAYWSSWLSPLNNSIKDELKNLLKRSLTVIKLLMSENGALVASTDFEIIRVGGDNYNYVWPRDASYCAEALDSWGYYDDASKIFDFLFPLISEKGYFLHKYYPTGNFGSTWHPVPFIQIDQTGSFLYFFWKHYHLSRKIDQVAKNWDKIVKMGKFLEEYRDRNTGLPKPSWDLWEERKSISTYSSCAVYGGLLACSRLAEIMGRRDLKDYFLKASEEVKEGIIKYLYNERLKRFTKALGDESIDSSLFSIFYFEVLPAKDSRVINTMLEVERKLSVGGGIARYEGDGYFKVSDEIPGNPWVLTTLYLSIFYSEIGNFEKAKSLIEVVSIFNLLPEQFNPITGESVGVLPLAWSHAAFASALKKFLSN